jgi:hypothetical protein
VVLPAVLSRVSASPAIGPDRAARVLAAGMRDVAQTGARRLAAQFREVERRGVDLVLARERELGRKPVEQAFSNKGFDILSTDSKGDTFRIEVKARTAAATDFFVTHNEVLTGKNAVPRYRLALVRVASADAQPDEVRYLDDPFSATDLGDFEATGIRGDWAKMWD